MRYNHLLAVGAILPVIVFSTGSWSAGTKLDDSTILAIFDQANATDIYIGRLGAKYGYTEEVRKLGEMVTTDHVAVQQMGRDLASKLKITPTPPDNDASVANEAKIVAMLQSKSGRAFDEAYLRHELSFHQSVIDAIKGTLLPAIDNKAFRELVEKVLPGFEHHLAKTKEVAKKLGVSQEKTAQR